METFTILATKSILNFSINFILNFFINFVDKARFFAHFVIRASRI